MNPLFEKFFSVGDIKIGPTIISPYNVDGNILGYIQIYSTKKDIFLEKKVTGVVIRELNNTITEELYSALQYLSIDKVKFDYFVNQLYQPFATQQSWSTTVNNLSTGLKL